MRAKSYGFMLSLLRRFQVQKTIRATLLNALLLLGEAILARDNLQALRLLSFQRRIAQQAGNARFSIIPFFRLDTHLYLSVLIEPFAEQVVRPLVILRLQRPLTLRQTGQLALHTDIDHARLSHCHGVLLPAQFEITIEHAARRVGSDSDAVAQAGEAQQVRPLALSVYCFRLP